MSSQLKRILRFSAIVLLFLLLALGWIRRWDIYDAYRLRGYQPPAKIAELATQTSMNDKTRRLFYAYHPELDEKNAFSSRCRASELTIVLGCYVPNMGIYLYNVTDPRLNGVQQVTAAHEALHAAYDRLGGNDKKNVRRLIDDAYVKITDERIRDTIDNYRKNGADTTNELHSILGTEVRVLTPELEQYYKRYFINRGAVVEYSQKYEQAFTQRKQKIIDADKQLESIKKQIEGGEIDLQSRQRALQSERSRLDALLAAKDTETYNASVSGYNAQVNAYNASVERIRRLIDQFNSLVADRNAIAVEQGELIKAIDSRPDTIKAQ